MHHHGTRQATSQQYYPQEEETFLKVVTVVGALRWRKGNPRLVGEARGTGPFPDSGEGGPAHIKLCFARRFACSAIFDFFVRIRAQCLLLRPFPCKFAVGRGWLPRSALPNRLDTVASR